MATNEHGGYRRPERPAATSGPGAASQRTDGGPTNPARPFLSEGYGTGVAYRNFQQQTAGPEGEGSASAPPGATPSAPIPLPGGAGPSQGGPGQFLDVFAPNDSAPEPYDPATDPVQPRDQLEVFVRTMYSIVPDPAILALLD